MLQTRQDMETCLDNLKTALKNAKEPKEENKDDFCEISNCLQLLINSSSIFQKKKMHCIETDDIFVELLTHESQEIATKGAKTIAEIAKTANGREKFTSPIIVESAMKLLKCNDIDLLTQTCRALGNICNDNDKGRKLISEKNGLKSILEVLEKSVKLGNAKGAGMLRNVAIGFLLNFLIDQENILEKAIDENAIDVITSVLEIEDDATDDARTHALLVLGVFYDAKIQFLDERLTKVLVKILAEDASFELAEMCLELLCSQVDDDEDARLILAEAGVCELILTLLEKHGPSCINEDTRSTLKVACYLIVLILNGDKSMNLLFNDGKGQVYEKLVDWLESKDEDLLVCSVLAMGNFARTDKHSEFLVSQGVHKKLLSLVEKCVEKGDIRFQHALLSTLRNLVIPAANKPVVFDNGKLVEILSPMLQVPTFPVVFKLLGTLRIVVGGERDAAIFLGRKPEIVEKAVEWSCTEEYLGVKSEANRLLAWLVINSKDEQVISSLINHEALKHLIEMLLSPHCLMQNEALLSLSIIAATRLTDKTESQFIDAEISNKLCTFFQNNSPNLDLAVFSNILTLLEQCAKSGTILDHLKKSCLRELLENFSKIQELNDEKLAERIKTLCVSMDPEI